MFAELHQTLRNPRRRQLVASLHEADSDEGVVLPADVATASDDPDDVMAELEADHLPYLERAGFVDWEPTRARVVPGPRFSELEPFLGVAEQCERQSVVVDWPN